MEERGRNLLKERERGSVRKSYYERENENNKKRRE